MMGRFSEERGMAGSHRIERVVLIRHGETLGESSIRFYGATNVALSELGFAQAREARRRIPRAEYDLAVASPLSRAWKTALIALPGAWVRLEPGFREINFGRWEGLTKEEIAERDPALYEQWQSGVAEFDFPDGERRSEFRGRVEAGLDRLLARGARSMIVVAHKGVVRTIVEALTEETVPQPRPALGEVLELLPGDNGRLRVVGS